MTGLRVRSRVAAARDCDAVVASDIAVGVRHSGNNWAAHVERVDLVVAGGEVARIVARHHGCRVLVSNSRLRSHQLLILYEGFLPLSFVACQLIVVVLGTDGDHGSLRIVTAMLLTLIQILALGVTDEDDVALVDSCRVRARVGTLLVAPSQTGPTPVVGVHSDRITIDVSLSETEK